MLQGGSPIRDLDLSLGGCLFYAEYLVRFDFRWRIFKGDVLVRVGRWHDGLSNMVGDQILQDVEANFSSWVVPDEAAAASVVFGLSTSVGCHSQVDAFL